MKKVNILLLFAAFFAGMFLYGCENIGDNINPQENSAIPEKFTVEIPSSLSNDLQSNARMADDTLQGNEVYRHLNLFIHVGERSAKLVEGIMKSIRRHDLSQELTLEYTSEDDGRDKLLTVVEGSNFDGKDWAYQLTVVDVADRNEEDGGLAMQVFWNTDPVEGISILKPYNIDRRKHNRHEVAMYRVDYSEAGANGYEAEMTVQIAKRQLVDSDPFSIKAMKMFVGKKGDIVDVYGNSNHPRARFRNEGLAGFNWAFVASGNEAEDYAVAEVGLPYSSTDASDRETLLEVYSVRNVMEREIKEDWPEITQEMLDAYLLNTAAPGYFEQGRFVQGGEAPDEKYAALEANIETMAPFNPSVISSLSIEFKK